MSKVLLMTAEHGHAWWDESETAHLPVLEVVVTYDDQGRETELNVKQVHRRIRLDPELTKQVKSHPSYRTWIRADRLYIRSTNHGLLVYQLEEEPNTYLELGTLVSHYND